MADPSPDAPQGFWSERTVFGLLIIAGFLLIAAVAIGLAAPADRLQLARDVLLTLGPLMGLIVQAIFKTDRTDKQNAQSISNLSTAVQTAMTLPPSPEAPVPPVVQAQEAAP